VHNYSCATHCHKWLKPTEKGIRKVPRGEPTGSLFNRIANTISGLGSLAIGGWWTLKRYARARVTLLSSHTFARRLLLAAVED